MFYVRSSIWEFDNGAAFNGRLIGRLRQVLQVAEERRIPRQKTPMDAELRVFCLQDDAPIAVPEF
jgi:hypothetical protein